MRASRRGPVLRCKTAEQSARHRHLIEAKGVSQTDVAQATGLVGSTISEVFTGKRQLSRSHIGKLARYVNVDPGVFALDG